MKLSSSLWSGELLSSLLNYHYCRWNSLRRDSGSNVNGRGIVLKSKSHYSMFSHVHQLPHPPTHHLFFSSTNSWPNETLPLPSVKLFILVSLGLNIVGNIWDDESARDIKIFNKGQIMNIISLNRVWIPPPIVIFKQSMPIYWDTCPMPWLRAKCKSWGRKTGIIEKSMGFSCHKL